MTQREERTAFTALVLSGLWLIVRILLKGPAAGRDAEVWRGHSLGHMDVIGQQHDEARAHRRETTFPSLYP